MNVTRNKSSLLPREAVLTVYRCLLARSLTSPWFAGEHHRLLHWRFWYFRTLYSHADERFQDAIVDLLSVGMLIILFSTPLVHALFSQEAAAKSRSGRISGFARCTRRGAYRRCHSARGLGFLPAMKRLAIKPINEGGKQHSRGGLRKPPFLEMPTRPTCRRPRSGARLLGSRPACTSGESGAESRRFAARGLGAETLLRGCRARQVIAPRHTSAIIVTALRFLLILLRHSTVSSVSWIISGATPFGLGCRLCAVV